jgi:hypothetical protein
MPILFPPALSISQIIKFTRDFHNIDIDKISLIKDVDNTPGATEDNFDCSEGRAILAAVRKYNGDLPLDQAIKVQSSGANNYDLTVIEPEWNHREFRITNIQWPIDENSLEPTFMKKTFWHQSLDPTTGKPVLKFMRGNSPGSEFSIHFTRPHQFSITEDETTIPEDHWEIIAKIAAANILEMAAGIVSSFSDQATGYSSKDLGSIQNRYLELATKYREQYDALVNGEINNAPPVIVEWDLDAPLGERVFHPRSLYS